MEKEIIEIVNKKGQVVTKSRRSTAYKKGLLHKAVNILIFNKKGEIFLQKRSKIKSSFPLHWDISCSEHLKPNESYKEAALRGLIEELSIKTSIKILRKKHHQQSKFYKKGQQIIENELVVLYQGTYDGKIKMDKNEVYSGKFLSLKKVKTLLLTPETRFTPWAKDELEFLLKEFPFKIH